MTTRYSLPLLLILLLVLLPISIDPRGGVLLAEDEAGKEKVVRRSIPLEDNYLLIPIQNGAPSIAVDFEIDGVPVRQFDCELAPRAEEADFWAFLDLTPFGDKTATLHAKGATESQLAAIRQADSVPESDAFYREPLRPQFHFSQKLGWNNDPNGMVYHDGKWHLYFQHNPYGWKWGNMHWGHAVSDDLVHWQQLPIAIYNKARGDYAFSGGAVVDENNTAGWQQGERPPIVASWTSTGRGECLAYSNDGGRTFTEYEGNPVVKHQGRDPKIIWHEEAGHWVMAVYDESKKEGRSVAFYSSPDLKQWTLESKLPDYYECPEIFKLAVDGDPDNTRWIVFAADGRYAVGTFDGKQFTAEHEGKHRLHHGSYYASQLFSNAPDGRKIQIGWAQIPMPDMPFNQTFSFPHELSLRNTEDGLRMFAEPVRELAKLYGRSEASASGDLFPGDPITLPGKELMDVEATFQLRQATKVGLQIGGERIVYDVAAKKLDDAPLAAPDSEITIRVLVDRPMLEIIGGEGRVVITRPRKQPGQIEKVTAFAEGGEAELLELSVRQLDSIWKRQ
jgi:fructan beta-fructosidase